jgi:hypothetical protein
MADYGALVRCERRGESHDSKAAQCRGSSTVSQACSEEMVMAGAERGTGGGAA